MNRKMIIKKSKVSHGPRYPDTSGNLSPLELPTPAPGRGTSVWTALQKRKTTREISDRKLSAQLLSNLLWAACGVNRKTGPFDIPGRTAASASNSQEIDLYVAMENGTFLYDGVHHRLDAVLAEDLRPLAIGAGQTEFMARLQFSLSTSWTSIGFPTLPVIKSPDCRTPKFKSHIISPIPA